MKKNIIKNIAAYLLIALVGGGLLASCQDRDLPGSGAMQIAAPDAAAIQGTPSGTNNYDYTLTWPAAPAGQQMLVAIYRNGMQQQALTPTTGTSFTLSNVATHEPYEFVFKLTDGTNTSNGTIVKFTRPGSYPVTNLKMESVDNNDNTFSARATWTKVEDATKINITATNGQRTVEQAVDGSATEFAVTGCAKDEVWKMTLVAENAEGKALPAEGSVKVGRTAVGFLSIYDTPEELVEKGDDDEASAWLWLHQQYPDADFLPFGSIDGADKVQKYRVLWWYRDLEGVGEEDIWTMPDKVMAATPYIQQWYKDGGSLLLWSHATPYIGTLGRLDTSLLRNNTHTFGAGEGGPNGDTWKMGVGLSAAGFTVDYTTHPIYNGMNFENGDKTKLLPVKGPGWTEDHNCLWFDIPTALTGLPNQDPECYKQLTETYGIYPLGTWDSQVEWISQLNNWEAQQGNTEFKGTIICIGNGGCEFSMKNSDGTPDKSANPKNNSCQGNILKMAQNAIEYLKTR